MNGISGPTHWRAYAALLVVYLIWGTTLGATRIGVETLPPALLACARYVLAGTLLVGFVLTRGEGFPGWRDVARHLLIGFLLFVMGNALSGWAVLYIPTGLGGMMVATTPFWMVGINSLVPPRDVVKPWALLGIAVGFVGIGLLFLPNLAEPRLNSPAFWGGVGMMLLTALMWSTGSIVARRMAVGTSLLMSVGLQSLLAGLLLLPVCLATVDWSLVRPSGASLLALWHLVLLGTVVATPCYLYILKTLPVSVASTFAYVTPVLTVLFGWSFLHEPLSLTMIAGCLVVLAGVGLVQWANRGRLKVVNGRSLDMNPGNDAASPIQPLIRPIRPEDNPAVRDLIIDTLREYGRTGPGYACNDAETQAMYEAYRATDSLYYVIEDGASGRVLGGGGFSRLKETGPAEGICELQKLYFRPELRGLGLGRALLVRLIDEAAVLGYREMYLETVPDMADAIRLYERTGFQRLPRHKGNTGHAGNCPVYMNLPLEVPAPERGADPVRA